MTKFIAILALVGFAGAASAEDHGTHNTAAKTDTTKKEATTTKGTEAAPTHAKMDPKMQKTWTMECKKEHKDADAKTIEQCVADKSKAHM